MIFTLKYDGNYIIMNCINCDFKIKIQGNQLSYKNYYLAKYSHRRNGFLLLLLLMSRSRTQSFDNTKNSEFE